MRRWVVSLGGGAFAEMRWLSFVPWWNTAGLSDCVPIVSASLTAQTQFFLIYQVRSHTTPFELRGAEKRGWGAEHAFELGVGDA